MCDNSRSNEQILIFMWEGIDKRKNRLYFQHSYTQVAGLLLWDQMRRSGLFLECELIWELNWVLECQCIFGDFGFLGDITPKEMSGFS